MLSQGRSQRRTAGFADGPAAVASTGPASSTHWTRGRVVATALALTGAIVVLWITSIRNTGLYPVVLSDEYRYSKAARLAPFAESSVANYLYLLVYRSTNACNENFLACARWLNLAFFGIATIFVYRTARLFMGTAFALIVAAVTLSSPFSTYTAYFMPEAMYFCGFWALTWLVLSTPSGASVRASLGRQAAIGAALGALALVKPHALFLVPALLFHDAVVAWLERTMSPRAFGTQMLTLLASAAIVKFGVGWAIAGPAGLALFGTYYATIATTADLSSARPELTHAVSGGLANLSGHLLALVLLFAMPVASLLSSAGRSRPAATGRPLPTRLPLYTVSCLGVLVAMATVFTVTVEGQGPYETLDRLHGRYYDFVLPLLVMVGAVTAQASSPRRSVRCLIALPLAAVLLHAGLSGLAPFDITLTDYPQLRGITEHGAVRHTLALLGLVALLFWCVEPRHAAVWFLFAVMPFAAWKGSAVVSAQLDARRTPDLYDRAGAVARQAWAGRAETPATVFGDDAAGVYRALFQIDESRATSIVLGAGEPVDGRLWPASSDRAVVIGEHPLAGIDADVVAGNGFVLLRRRPARR